MLRPVCILFAFFFSPLAFAQGLPDTPYRVRRVAVGQSQTNPLAPFGAITQLNDNSQLAGYRSDTGGIVTAGTRRTSALDEISKEQILGPYERINSEGCVVTAQGMWCPKFARGRLGTEKAFPGLSLRAISSQRLGTGSDGTIAVARYSDGVVVSTGVNGTPL